MAVKKLSKVERLRIAGVVAPAVRRGSERKVTVVAKDGSPIREMTLDEVQASLAKRQEIEFGVRDDAPQTVCAGWEGKCPKEAKPRKGAFEPSKVKRRCGEPWRCALCGRRRTIALRTPEQLRAAGRKANASKTPEQRREIAIKRSASLTPEQRREIARKAKATMTPEQRSEAARKRNAALTPEQRREATRAGRTASAARAPSQRSEGARKGKASMTPEQRSEAARKGRARRRGQTLDRRSQPPDPEDRAPNEKDDHARRAAVGERARRQ